VGKAAAASCTQFLVDTFAPKYIINTGVAGGIGNGLQIGDVVIGKELVYHDFDATALGYAKGYICNGINSNEPTIFKSDKILVEKIEKTAIKTLSKDKVHKGRIASGDMFIGTAEKKREIKEQFGAIAAEMESTSIAHIATLNGIPFVIIRAIADLADGTKTDNFLEFEQSSAKISSNIIKNLLEEME
jgi:adenosylhomocysteine nucleosidase